MHKKTIKEMSFWEKKHTSLEAKSFHAVLMGSLVLGVVTLFIGLGLYVYSLGTQYIRSANDMTKNVSNVIANVVDMSSSCRQTMDIYHSLSEEERAVQDDAYFERFSEITETDNYNIIMSVLREFMGNSDVNDVFIGVYDEETQSLVYVADPDQVRPCPTGTWEEADAKEIKLFNNWNGQGLLYYVGYTEKYGWLCTTGTPIYEKNGTVSGYVMADITLQELLRGMKNFTIQYLAATVLIVLILGYFFSRHIKKEMVEPINSIALAAENYAADKLNMVHSGKDHFEGLNISTGDEIENLYLTLSDMEKDLASYEEDLTRAVQEGERIGTELNLAMRIQKDMLPSTFPAFPERKEFDIYASMIPAKEVGGDFYDYFFIDEDHLVIVIADVSGKGVPAALFMMASDILIRTTARAAKGSSPAEILESINDQVATNNSQEMFVTVWLGILEISTGKLTAANAGHEYPMVKHAGGDFELYKDKHGFVVGGLKGMKYKDYVIQMDPGSRLYVYTDGVTEAADEKDDLYGTDRLLNALNMSKDKNTREIIENVVGDVKEFTGSAPQFDDITSLCIHYLGHEQSAKEITLESTVENIGKATEFVDSELEALGWPIKAQAAIDVAIDEIFGNIAHYAYDPGTGPVTMRVESDSKAVEITFMDKGKPFDPLKKADPDVRLSAEERKIGGLGIFLVKKTMDDMTYEYKDGQNILKIRKNIRD